MQTPQPARQREPVTPAPGPGMMRAIVQRRYGAEVTGVCSTAKADLVRSIGADHVIDYTREDFVGGRSRYDLILDTGGNSGLSRLRRAAAPRSAGRSWAWSPTDSARGTVWAWARSGAWPPSSSAWSPSAAFLRCCASISVLPRTARCSGWPSLLRSCPGSWTSPGWTGCPTCGSRSRFPRSNCMHRGVFQQAAGAEQQHLTHHDGQEASNG